MKIGILGGTFDPIHIGHLLLGEFAYAGFGLDEVWFLPNGGPPHKDYSSESVDYLAHRIKMVEKAIADVPYFKLSLAEAKKDVSFYTYKTMEYFKEECHGIEFYFILGADALFSIEQWRSFEKIFPTCTILAAMRENKDVDSMMEQIQYLKNRYDANISLLRAPLLEISSTTIRNRIQKHQSVRYMVPDNVIKYIADEDLYV
ncbi:MAG: nicotinate-nucleotide adenylyltransferase [Lachnospiraceae bacterium]|nr:nicotinate-nucleotide adenylyltransferase [Lachnospiraceae bacterium]